MYRDWLGKQVLVTVGTSVQGRPIQVEGALKNFGVDDDVPAPPGIGWIEVDVMVGRPGLVRIPAGQIVTVRLVGE